MAVDLAFSAGRLFVALFLVALNGFFVASEFAFVRVRSTSVEQLVAEGKAGAETLDAVMSNLDDYLAVTQLGITLASLGLGWAGEPAVASLIEPVLGTLLPPSLLHLVAFAIAFSFITFLHVVFGELAPKTLAIADAERVSLFVAPPMRFCYFLFYPAMIVFNGTANAFTRMLGVPPASETDETLEEREIRRVLARAGEAGNVDAAEVEMIDRIFALDDTTVREVMVPRPDVTTISDDASLPEIRDIVRETGHTRYPVIDADEQVIGFVDVKDVLHAIEADETATAGDLAHEMLVVPETVPIDQLLLQFRSESQQMAAIIDEWGAFEGIATVEDIVEIVVGDLRDEFDTDAGEPSIRQQADGTFEMDGGVPLWVASDALGVELESSDYETVGGLVLEELDRAPEPGDSIEVDGHLIEVESVEGSRISTLLVREADEMDGSDAADDGSDTTDDSAT